MISTSRVQKQVHQVQQFDAAVNNFISKFSTIPGDSIAAGCNNALCGNNSVDDSYRLGGIPTVWFFNYEVSEFWPQLAASGFNEGGITYSPLIPVGFDVNSSTRNSPATAIDRKGGVVVGTTNLTPQGYLSVYVTNYQLADYTAMNAADSIQCMAKPFIKGSDAMAIDAKIDDGKPVAGRVYGMGSNDCSIFFYYGQASHVGCSTYTDYESNGNCVLNIEVLSQQGGYNRN